ncbi:MAG: RNA 2',3'-cyclic phosphodiesterase [Candidatus Aminicenantales bacterium]
MRTFIAINFDPDLKKNLIGLVAKLKKKKGHIRWAHESSMHLTLKFLGEINPEQAAAVENILKEISGNHRSFDLNLKGTGYFPPNRRSPRVLWIGVAEAPLLLTIQEDLDSAFEKMGFQREQRNFHPHLTLGRVQSPSNIKETLDELEKERNSDFGRMVVKKLTFFRSTLKPTGAEYTVLSEFELQ